MADWQFTPEGAQAAKVAAAGGLGAAMLVYIRHPGTLVRAGLMIALGVGMASLFADEVEAFGVTLTAVQTGALWGLLGKVAADRIVIALEAFDVAQFLPKGKP